MTPSPQVDVPLMADIFGAQGRTFRGGLIENAKRFQFRGSGYDAMPKEQNGHFMIETARQIAGPLMAMTDDAVRVVHVIGATQVLKSMVGDNWVIYWFEHVLRKMIVYFEDDGKADLFCSQRLMETLRHHPHLQKLLDAALNESRHNVQGTWLKIGGVELLVCGLNEGNVSTLSWPAIWISEAWQHKKDGLLKKAFKRADRYPDTKKILNESQAGMADDDLHKAVKTALQVALKWRCPACDGVQTWEWKHWNHRRPGDFKPREQKKVSTINVGGETVFVSTDIPMPGSYAGMRFGKKLLGSVMEESVDDWSIDEKARAAYWECIWCGYRIDDTSKERNRICETYDQEYRTLERDVWRSPKEVCFTIPFEAAANNKFEATVKDYLIAREAKSYGNRQDLVDYFLRDRAVFYDDTVDLRRTAAQSMSSYDPSKYRELMGDKFHCVQMTVDCHKATWANEDENIIGALWFEVRAFEKLGNSKQLARGWVFSWELLKAQQIYWGVPAPRVLIDSAWMPDQVAEAAVRFHDYLPGKVGTIFANTPIPLTWTLCEGSKWTKNSS